MLTGAAALRQSTNYNENLRDGDFLAIAAALTSPQRRRDTCLTARKPHGRLVRNGCDRIATIRTELCLAERRRHSAAVLPRKLPCCESAVASRWRDNRRVLQNKFRQRQLPLHGGAVHAASDAWFQRTDDLHVVEDHEHFPAPAVANPLNRRADYARPFSSVTHDLRTNGVIELPIGPNKLLFGNSSGWLARVLERWQAGAILNLSSGTPTSITALGGLTYGTTVPNVVGPWDRAHRHMRSGTV